MSHLQLVQVCFTRISWPNATVIIGQVTHKLTCMVSTRHGLQHPIIRGKVGWTMTWSSSVKPTLVFESWWRPSTIQRLSTKSLEQDLFRNIVKKIYQLCYYQALCPTPLPAQDALKRDPSRVPRVHLYGAGPPCQPLSMAGRKRGLVPWDGFMLCFSRFY